MVNPFHQLAQVWPVPMAQAIQYKVGLFRVWQIVYIVGFVYYYVMLLTSPIWNYVETEYYFDVSASSVQSIELTDLLSNASTYSINQLVFLESPSVVLVTTKFVDTYEELNMENNQWTVVNSTEVYVPVLKLLSLDVSVVARLQCVQPSTHDTFIFSNYAKNDPNYQIFWGLSIGSILRSAKVASTGLLLDQCAGTGDDSDARDWTYYSSNRSLSVNDCCSRTCPYAGIAYGKGADFSLTYKWDCNLNVYSNPADFRYQCAKDTLDLDVHTISSSSFIQRYDIIQEANIQNERLFRRTRLSTALRMRFKGTGMCREEKPFDVLKLTTDFASARAVLFAGSVILMISVAIFSRYNDIEETSPTVELVNGQWVLIPANNEEEESGVAQDTSIEKRLSMSKVAPSDDVKEGQHSFISDQTPSSSPHGTLVLQSFDGGNDILVDDRGAVKVTTRRKRKSRQRSQFELGVI